MTYITPLNNTFIEEDVLLAYYGELYWKMLKIFACLGNPAKSQPANPQCPMTFVPPFSMQLSAKNILQLAKISI
jgi:hypothetical protein